MAVKYAAQVFSINSNDRISRMGDKSNDRFAQAVVGFFLSTTDAAISMNSIIGTTSTTRASIGGEDFSTTAADTIILGGVGIGMPGSISNVGVSGAIKVTGIEIYTSVTLPNHASIVAKAYRNQTIAAGGGWSNTYSGASASALVTVSYAPGLGASVQAAIFATAAIHTAVATSDPAAVSLQALGGGVILQQGDLLVLHGDGAGDLTAGVGKIEVIVHYTRLTPGARLTGLGDVVEQIAG